MARPTKFTEETRKKMPTSVDVRGTVESQKSPSRPEMAMISHGVKGRKSSPRNANERMK